MPDKKLTDSEIVKVLERLKNTKDYLKEQYQEQVKKCPYPELKPIAKQTYEDNKKAFDIAIKAIEEFNRLQAEIKHLDDESDALRADIDFRDKEINELQAENERLEKENEEQYEIARDTIRAEIADGGTSCHWCEDIIRGTAKAEAYKECIEKVKEILIGFPRPNNLLAIRESLDNLLKELVGDNNAGNETAS